MPLFMRTDQFLWQLKYSKSINLSTDTCKKGIMKLNNNIIKPLKEIRIREVVKIKKTKEGI